jgi:hypothetical protein
MAEQEQQPAEEPNLSSVEEMLTEPFVDASVEAVAACKEENDFTRLAHGLYREAGVVASVCSSVCTASGTLPRNQAICAGFLVRIAKFMISIAQLTASEDRREVVMALSRCITESATNLRFLILKKEDALYEAFIRSSLGPEREVVERIKANVKARNGKVLPIEERMLESVDRLCKTSGVKIEDLPARSAEWGGNMRQKLEALGLAEHAYVSLQRFGSHAVHGTWVDLLVHHLTEQPGSNGSEFKPRGDFSEVDERLLGQNALYVLDGAEAYLHHFCGDVEELKTLYARITDLKTRIIRVMEADEKNVQKRRGQLPADDDGASQVPPQK